MKTSVGKTKLELANGDITELEVDAIVAPASTELWMDHGVAAAIKRVGGEAVEKEAVLQGPVQVGEAVVTTGHDLKARWVIHVALTDAGPTADAGRRHRRDARLAGRRRARPRPLGGPSGARHRRLRVPALPVRQPHGRRGGGLPQGAPPHGPAPRDAVCLRRRGEGGVQERHGRHRPDLAAGGARSADDAPVSRRLDGRDRAGARPAAHHRGRRRRPGAAHRRSVHHRPRLRGPDRRSRAAPGLAPALQRPRLLRLPPDPAVRVGVQAGGQRCSGTSGDASPSSSCPVFLWPSFSPLSAYICWAASPGRSRCCSAH